MTNPALAFLFGRLLSPIPRIRWEVARSIGRLIREHDEQASIALLEWIGSRSLESEVTLGLGIVEAFDLGKYFDFADVSSAVGAPSHLSDFMLKMNFPNADGLSPLRYSLSSEDAPKLTAKVDSWFERYRRWAVPPVFSYVLEYLEETTSFPFFEQWRHEWRWLQAMQPRPDADYPFFFSNGDRSLRGQFDHGQRELYLSAYLRTLAHGSMVGAISYDDAEHYSLLALPLNRGLGDLEPIDRPDWAYNLQSRASDDITGLARELWAAAANSTKSHEVPIAVKAVEFDKTGFVEIEMKMAIEPRGYQSCDKSALVSLGDLEVGTRSGRFEGQTTRYEGYSVKDVTGPVSLMQTLMPAQPGRAHVEIATDIELASPQIFGVHARVVCDGSEIRLETQNEMFSTWQHWYADWEPTTFPELASKVGRRVTVSRASMDRLRMLVGIQLRCWVSVSRMVRPSSHGEYTVESKTFCL